MQKNVSKRTQSFRLGSLISIESAPFAYKKIKLCKTLTETISSADKIVIANPLLELELFDWENTKNKTVIDCWRCLSSKISKQYRGMWDWDRTLTKVLVNGYLII